MITINFPGHIHVHSEYSLLDGLGSIREYVERSKELGYEFMALTEHGNMFSLYEAGKVEAETGFHIIKGCEFYTEEFNDYKIGHLILLAKNQKGLRDLFELNAKAQANFYYKPRVSAAALREIGSRGNLVCTTACIANVIHQAIKKGNREDAKFEYNFLKDVFGEDLYFELQTSADIDEKEAYVKAINLFPDAKFVLTGDVHYPTKDDREVQDVLISINTKEKMNSPKKMRMKDFYHMMGSDELYGRFMENYNDENLFNECCYNLKEIAKKCSETVTMESTKALPVYDGMTNEQATVELRRLVNEGVKNKLIPNKEYNPEFREDLVKEVDVISSEGYSGYFLIVNEYCNWARRNFIKVGDGRGSGAGSKVAYTIGITDVNPQKYNLLFERFLAPGRTPDFDVDFSDINAVFKHLQEKYGETNVARVGAYTRFSEVTAIQKVMSAYGFAYGETKRCMESSEDYAKVAAMHPEVDYAVKRLIGKVEHMSTHAGGVVIVEDLIKKLPVFVRGEEKEKLIVGLDKRDIEELGHYKFDILGLSGLDILDNIEKQVQVDFKQVDFNDTEIYQKLQTGDVDGVFQLSGQREKVIQQQPECFEDLIAINALIRPGVCDWNEYLEARKNPPEDVLPFMSSTHGLIVYQEQYELLAEHYCGWGIGYSDKHLRKNKDILNDFELREKFVKDGTDNGYDIKFMKDLWNTISEIVSQGYSFNKSHAAAYAVLSFKTAYYKVYYPEVFYSAILTQSMNDPARLTHYISVARKDGMVFSEPNLETLTDRFEKVSPGTIQIPIVALKGVGASVYEELKRLAPIKSLGDLLERRSKMKIKKNHLVCMIRAGMFGDAKKEMLKEVTDDEYDLRDWKCEFDCYGYYINHSPFIANQPSVKESPNSFRRLVQISKVSKKKDKNGDEYAWINMFNETDSFEGVMFARQWRAHKMKVEQGDIGFVEGRLDGDRAILESFRRVEI